MKRHKQNYGETRSLKPLEMYANIFKSIKPWNKLSISSRSKSIMITNAEELQMLWLQAGKQNKIKTVLKMYEKQEICLDLVLCSRIFCKEML